MGGSLDAMDCPIDCLVDIRIVEDDVWTLSTELKGDVFEVAPCRSFHDLPPGEGRAGESDFLDTRVLANRLTSGVSVSDNEIVDTRGESGFVDHLSRHESGQRSELGAFHHDRVSGSQSGADLPAPHQNYKGVRQYVQQRCISRTKVTYGGSSRG